MRQGVYTLFFKKMKLKMGNIYLKFKAFYIF